MTADDHEVTPAPDTCVLCGADNRTVVVLVLSSKSGFERYVCASPTACQRRRKTNAALAAAEARGYRKGRTEAAEAIRSVTILGDKGRDKATRMRNWYADIAEGPAQGDSPVHHEDRVYGVSADYLKAVEARDE